MTTTDIFRMLKLAYPFLEAFKVEYDESYGVFDLTLEMSEDAPGLETVAFVGHDRVEEAIANAIQVKMIA
jgi:hypothetical protein